MKRVAGATATVGAALLLVTGCNSNGADVNGAESSAPTVDKAKIPTLMLGKADLPAGYQLMEVPKDKAQELADSMTTSAKNATVTPSHCHQVSAYPSSVKADELGTTVAMKTTSMLVETVGVVDQDLEKIRKNASGDCSKLTIQINDGPAAGAEAKADVTVLDGPKTEADEAVVLQQKMAIKMNGTTTKTTTVVGFAKVNGYLVSVQTSDAAPGGSPDLAAFNSFFTKAIDKVASKTS
ncbi:hypothetical protein [Gordonia phthalatica]|uniref:DUF5642 domain-containing protein n=1 Tax=Gordonia phthalatica TaxID=1136941 RepID=A0A0N9NL72_9ACTN|nr:hypothetical protein [Gordonia phthalatica]ALG86491.1 hypothetical protein ACH46_00735 [Gordonia phthalatica]